MCYPPPRARAHVQFGKPLVSQVTTKLEANKKTTKSAKTCVSARARTPQALVACVRSLPPCARSFAHAASGVPLPAVVPLRELRAAGALQRQHMHCVIAKRGAFCSLTLRVLARGVLSVAVPHEGLGYLLLLSANANWSAVGGVPRNPVTPNCGGNLHA